MSIISGGLGGAVIPPVGPGRALVGFGAKPRKIFGIFIVFPHENVRAK